jgi:hypothetical protein
MRKLDWVLNTSISKILLGIVGLSCVGMSKAHFVWKGLTIASDERDVCVNGRLDYEIYKWCDETSVAAEIYMKMDDKSIWRIKDDRDRAWFHLRWSNHIIPRLQ